ncbi:MAG TPA: DUF309 domain-containing protein [Planctomycetota bacterium]|nr:DUF309 domain-containing protein [Planctomycetota bacterium]
MREPLPIDADAPRYAPLRELPGHRYLPGYNARPKENDLPPAKKEERLEDSEAFRYGVDLYNRSYFWEAHEAWESLWQDLPDGPTREALQGLIQLAAAHLKEHMQVPTGAKRLAETACEHLEKAMKGGVSLGLDLASLARRAKERFEHPGEGTSVCGIRIRDT